MAEQLSIQLDLIFETVFNELFPELRKLSDKAEHFGNSRMKINLKFNYKTMHKKTEKIMSYKLNTLKQSKRIPHGLNNTIKSILFFSSS
jgi:hypothetical protein